MRRNSTCGETAWNTIQRSHINDIPKGDSNTFFSNFDSIKCYQPHTQHIISKKNNQTRKMWSQKSPRDACGTCTLGGTCWNPHPGSFSKLDFLPTGDRCWKKKITHAKFFLSFCWSCFTPKRPGKLWVEKKTQMADLIRRGATLVRFLLSTKCTCASMSEESKCFGKRSTSRFRSNSSNFRNCWFVYPNKFPSFCSHLDQEDNPKTLHCLADEQSMIHQHHTFCTLQGDPPCLQLSKNDHGHTWFLPWSASTVEQSGVQKMSIQSVGGLFHLNQHSQAFGWVLGSTYIAIPKVEFMNVECFTGQFSFCLSNASWRICLKQIAPVVHVPKGQPKSMEIVDGWATVS